MADLTALNETEIAHRLAGVNGWEREGMTIKKTFQMETYMTGLAFAAAVGTVCEVLGHHPDILIGWRRVTVSFTTHDAGYILTGSDFDAAAAVDALKYPPA